MLLYSFLSHNKFLISNLQSILLHVLTLQNIRHSYNNQAPTLQLETFTAQENEHWLLLGKSGCGKTTLLHILAGLLKPSNGEVRLRGQSLYSLKPTEIDRIRARNMGIVFQKTHLINTLSVAQNLEIAQYMAGLPTNRKRIAEVLEQLQLGHRLKHYPSQLSGGEAQRLAVARAVLNAPSVLLADEPTASLDDENAGKVIDLLKTQAQQYNAILLIATHDQRVKNNFEKVLAL